jgi:hypothetical protein
VAKVVGSYPGVPYTPLRDLLNAPQTNAAVGGVTRRIPLAVIESGAIPLRSPSSEQ